MDVSADYGRTRPSRIPIIIYIYLFFEGFLAEVRQNLWTIPVRLTGAAAADAVGDGPAWGNDK